MSEGVEVSVTHVKLRLKSASKAVLRWDCLRNGGNVKEFDLPTKVSRPILKPVKKNVETVAKKSTVYQILEKAENKLKKVGNGLSDGDLLVSSRPKTSAVSETLYVPKLSLEALEEKNDLNTARAQTANVLETSRKPLRSALTSRSFAARPSSPTVEVESSGPGTLTEVLFDMNRRIKAGQSLPSYVPTVSDLPVNHLSWDGVRRVLTAGREGSPSRTGSPSGTRLKPLPQIKIEDMNNEGFEEVEIPVIDIIGCHQPIDLILAKAEKKIRHTVEIQHSQSIKLENKRKEVLDEIAWRASRAERIEAALQTRKRVFVWTQFVKVADYLRLVSAKYSGMLDDYRKNILKRKQSMVLSNRIERVLRRKRQGKWTE